MSPIDDGGSMVCPVHGTRTRITCVTCGRPICPKCAVEGPIGLTCGEHPQRVIRLVRWTPARGSVRPAGGPMLPLLAGGFAAAAGGRAAAAFFFALAPGRPWVGITLLRVVVAAITFGFLYWVLRRR